MVGILLPLLALIFPKQQKWIPSAAGIGLAWTFHWYYSLMFFVGAVIGYGFEKTAPEASKEYTFPVASGIIAGGSLMAVLLAHAGGLISATPQSSPISRLRGPLWIAVVFSDNRIDRRGRHCRSCGRG